MESDWLIPLLLPCPQSRSRLESKAAYTVSKLNLVDLAGSERLGKTNVGKVGGRAGYPAYI